MFTDCGPSDLASPEFIVAGLDWQKGSFKNWYGLLCVLAGGKFGQEDVRTTVERLAKYSPITLLNWKCPPTICLFGEKPSAPAVAKGDERGYLAFLNVLAKELAEKGGDKAMLAELGKIAASPRRTLADYDVARAQLRAMLRK